MSAPPSHDDLEDLLLSCRYGELEEVQQFVQTFGWQPLNEVRDENGNTVLHMICGNGHIGSFIIPDLHINHRSSMHASIDFAQLYCCTDLLTYLLPNIAPSLLPTPNTSGKSTPLHWAALNSHLPIVKALIEYANGPGPALIDVKNEAGRSPLGEAELVGWDEGAKYFVQVMGLTLDGAGSEEQEISEGKGVEEEETEVELVRLSTEELKLGNGKQDALA